MDPLVTIEELAIALRRKVSGVRSDVQRFPERLPPRCKIPGSRRLLWRRVDVEAGCAISRILEIMHLTSRAHTGLDSHRQPRGV